MSKSALRVLEIMEFIAGQPAGCSHTTVAQGLGIPKSSLTALLQDLQSKGYLQRHPDTGYFTIGVQVLWLANSYLRNLNLVKIGQPVVAELFTQIRQFSTLAIPSGAEYVIVCTESTPSVFGHTLQVGSRGPMHTAALGKAMLAWLPAARLEQVLLQAAAVTGAKSIKGKAFDIRAELAQARKSGIAHSRGEAIAGVDGYAAPVFNAGNVVVASLGVGIPSGEVSAREAARIETAIRKAARQLSAQLGWMGELPSVD
jgi:DNA-binding IclR family transcriptional regulator